jgi:drug/metabolite transporter (DMT)-like permease
MTRKTEPLGPRGWAGTALGFAGVVLLAAPGSDLSLHGAGVTAVLVATFAWAFGTLHGKKHVTGGGPLTRAGVEMATAAVVAFLVAPVSGGFLTGTPTPRATLALLDLALFGSVAAYTAHGTVTRAWSPARAGTYAYLNPVIAVLLGVLLLHEPFGSRVLVGMAVILAGVALVQLRARR